MNLWAAWLDRTLPHSDAVNGTVFDYVALSLAAVGLTACAASHTSSPPLPPAAARPASVFLVPVTAIWTASSDPRVNLYRIYQGVSSGFYTNTVSVPGTNRTQIAVDPLATNYFAASCVTTNGVESDLSPEVTYHFTQAAGPTNYTVQAFTEASPDMTNWFPVLTNSTSIGAPAGTNLFFRTVVHITTQ